MIYLAYTIPSLFLFGGIVLMFKNKKIFNINYNECQNINNKNNRDNIITLFFQGNSSNRAQGSKYAGKYGISCDGYKYVIKNSPLLLYNLYDYPELKEVKYYDNFKDLLNPINLFYFTISYLKIKLNKLDGGRPFSIDLREVSVGGLNNVIEHKKAFNSILKNNNQNKHIVLFGCSRGASTTLLSLCLDKEMQKKISLVILEAPFDSLQTLSVYSPFYHLKLKFLSKISKYYTPNQISPIDVVYRLDNKITIAFITSKIDNVVPEYSTLRLIEELKSNGNKNVHHLSLDNSSHNKMMFDDMDDIIKYNNFVENLYDKYCI